jgi:hypothetical protein
MPTIFEDGFAETGDKKAGDDDSAREFGEAKESAGCAEIGTANAALAPAVIFKNSRRLTSGLDIE